MFKSLLAASKLMRAERQPTACRVNPYYLPVVKFPVEDIETEWIENEFLDRAFQWPRPINRIVALAGDEGLGAIG